METFLDLVHTSYSTALHPDTTSAEKRQLFYNVAEQQIYHTCPLPTKGLCADVLWILSIPPPVKPGPSTTWKQLLHKLKDFACQWYTTSLSAAMLTEEVRRLEFEVATLLSATATPLEYVPFAAGVDLRGELVALNVHRDFIKDFHGENIEEEEAKEKQEVEIETMPPREKQERLSELLSMFSSIFYCASIELAMWYQHFHHPAYTADCSQIKQSLRDMAGYCSTPATEHRLRVMGTLLLAPLGCIYRLKCKGMPIDVDIWNYVTQEWNDATRTLYMADAKRTKRAIVLDDGPEPHILLDTWYWIIWNTFYFRVLHAEDFIKTYLLLGHDLHSQRSKWNETENHTNAVRTPLILRLMGAYWVQFYDEEHGAQWVKCDSVPRAIHCWLHLVQTRWNGVVQSGQRINVLLHELGFIPI